MDIVRELAKLKSHGIDLLGFIKKKVGNGENTLFWEEVWKGDTAFKYRFSRVFALESNKNITVASKLAFKNLGCSNGAFQEMELRILSF